MNYKRALLLLGLLFSVAGLYRIQQVPAREVSSAVNTLKSTETTKVVVRQNSVVIVRRKKDGGVSTEIKYKSPEGKTEVVEDTKKGTIVKVQQIGFCFSPGIGVAHGDSLLAALDVKYAFAWRLGLVAGVGFGKNVVVPYCGMSYHVYNNTSLFVGTGSHRFLAGIRLSF